MLNAKYFEWIAIQTLQDVVHMNINTTIRVYIYMIMCVPSEDVLACN